MSTDAVAWLRADRPKLIRVEIGRRAVPYLRMTQREAGMAKRGEGAKSDQINRYWDWKGEVGWTAKQAGVRMLGKDRLITVRCTFRVTRPLPDTDNLVKGILDSLKGVAYEDDRQVREEYGALIVVPEKRQERTVFYVGELVDVHRWEERKVDGVSPSR